MPVGQGSAPTQQIAQFRSDGFTAATGLRIQFFSDSFDRAFGLPQTRLVNMISEATPLREERPFVPLVGLREIRYSRPGLVSYANPGVGPIRGVYTQPNLGPNGALFVVSGTTLYMNGSPVRTIAGTDMVRFAGSEVQLVLVSSGTAYCMDFSTGAMPRILGLPPVSDVVFLGGYFVFSVTGSDTFYYSAVNDGHSIPGLNFESAEDFPDPTLAMAVLNDELVVFGSRTVQFFSLSQDPDAPFTPVVGRDYQRGLAAQASVAFADNALFWIGDNRVVYRTEGVPTRVSSSSIEDALRQCAAITSVTAFTATFEGHEFYVMNVPGVGSFAYDCSRVGETISTYGASSTRGEWGEWTSFGRTTFRGRCAAVYAGEVLIGDDRTNDLWAMRMGVYADGTDPLTRIASAFIKIEEGNPRCLNLVLHCVLGVGNPIAPGDQPVAEMRYSDDLGRTFNDWRQARLGPVGSYAPRRALWQRLGSFRAPGRLIEVRVTDPVNACFSHMELNAARPAW